MKNLKKYAPKKGCVLVLKSLAANLVAAHNRFQWPEKGQVFCPDWKPTKECGNGLHGWKWGEGDAGLRCKDDDAKWLILSVVESDIIDLTDKVKFPQCEVVYCGTRDEAVQIIQHYAPAGNKCVYGTSTSGHRGTSTSGDRGTSTSGMWGFIAIEFWDKDNEVYRKKMAQIDGINFLPGVKYRLNSDNEFEEVKNEQ